MTIKIKPTKGEKFKAKRRRDNLSQEQCAKKLGLCRMTIKYWEDDTPATPNVDIDLTEGELYFILRERIGLTLKKAAALMEMSHITLIRLEKAEGGHKFLRDFYKSYIQKNNIKMKELN